MSRALNHIITRSDPVYTAMRDFEVVSDGVTLASGSVRYRFTVTGGRDAVTWANADEGFSPAEEPTVDVMEIAVCYSFGSPFYPVTGMAAAPFEDVPEAWLLEQAMEGAQ